ncbi:uncharacterized protein [Dermacentor albipictus]|uniref:uncharacterized protein n=1 Tax=Dermacentor albipictus TaxID=60249 RepID=UPI0038FC7C1A
MGRLQLEFPLWYTRWPGAKTKAAMMAAAFLREPSPRGCDFQDHRIVELRASMRKHQLEKKYQSARAFKHPCTHHGILQVQSSRIRASSPSLIDGLPGCYRQKPQSSQFSNGSSSVPEFRW